MNSNILLGGIQYNGNEFTILFDTLSGLKTIPFRGMKVLKMLRTRVIGSKTTTNVRGSILRGMNNTKYRTGKIVTRKPGTRKFTSSKPRKSKPNTKRSTSIKSTTRTVPIRNNNRIKPIIRKSTIGKITKINPRIIPPTKLSFDNIKPNQVATFKAVYRERKDRSKPISKSNPIITKSLKIRDTKNRALRKVSNLVDNKLARSLEIKPIGITKEIKKDIPKPKILRKFRFKKSKNTPVLKLVEKTKYISDTQTEKKLLKLSRRNTRQAKSKNNPPSKRVSKVSNIKKPKKYSKIKFKRISTKKTSKKRR
jgi:hypothetical protein